MQKKRLVKNEASEEEGSSQDQYESDFIDDNEDEADEKVEETEYGSRSAVSAANSKRKGSNNMSSGKDEDTADIYDSLELAID